MLMRNHRLGRPPLKCNRRWLLRRNGSGDRWAETAALLGIKVRAIAPLLVYVSQQKDLDERSMCESRRRKQKKMESLRTRPIFPKRDTVSEKKIV